METYTTWDIQGIHCEAGLANSDELPEALEFFRARYARIIQGDSPAHDPVFDLHGKHLIARADGKLVGYLRLLTAEPTGYALEHVDFNGSRIVRFEGLLRRTWKNSEGRIQLEPCRHPLTQDTFPLERTVETGHWIGPTIGLPDTNYFLVSMLLLDAAAEYSMQNGIRFWIFVNHDLVYQRLKKDGWPVYELIPGLFSYPGFPPEAKKRLLVYSLKFPGRRLVSSAPSQEVLSRV